MDMKGRRREWNAEPCGQSYSWQHVNKPCLHFPVPHSECPSSGGSPGGPMKATSLLYRVLSSWPKDPAMCPARPFLMPKPGHVLYSPPFITRTQWESMSFVKSSQEWTPQSWLVFYSSLLDHLVSRLFYFTASLVFLKYQANILWYDLDNVENSQTPFFFFVELLRDLKD